MESDLEPELQPEPGEAAQQQPQLQQPQVQQREDQRPTPTQTPGAAAPSGYNVNAAHSSGTMNFLSVTIAAAPATDLNALTGGMPSTVAFDAWTESMRTTILGMVQSAMTEAIQMRPQQSAAETARADTRNADYKALQERATFVHWELLTVSTTVPHHRMRYYYNYILVAAASICIIYMYISIVKIFAC